MLGSNMAPDEPSLSQGLAGSGAFHTTHWSIVLRAGQSDTGLAQKALEDLCQRYWYPIYCFVRRRGYSPEDSQDLTQEFFSRLLASNGLASVDRTKGKFRSFLLASVSHLLANEWNRSQRQKRGGGALHFSLDVAAAEGRFRLEPSDELTPETIYERRWAETVVDSVTSRLEAEFAEAGMAKRFEVLKVFLVADGEPASYAEMARRIEVSEGAVRTAIYRMRQRYGELFRAEIAQTVSGPHEMEEELRHFLAVLGS
jgi:RNA polymerase sigma factor (sigma-70 family)